MIFCGNSTAAACPDKFSLPDIILPAEGFHKGQAIKMAGLDELTKLAHPGSWRLFIAYDNLCDAEDAAVPRNRTIMNPRKDT